MSEDTVFFWLSGDNYIILCSSHFPFLNRMVKIMALTLQSVNMPIHTAMEPKPSTRAKNMARLTRQIHMEAADTPMVNFTSPAARKP